MLVMKRGTAELQVLSNALGLHPWLVEALAVEHLPCRRVEPHLPALVMDFALISEAQIKGLSKPVVLLNAPLLLHNVTADTMSYRLFLGTAAMFGARMFPVATLAEQSSMFMPDGKVSPHYHLFPRQDDQPDADEKLSLNIFGYALVLDDDGLYQWQIAHDAYSLTTYSSEILSRALVSELERIVVKLDSVPFSNDEATSTDYQEQVETLYEELEQVRSTMQDAVLAHHRARKGTAEALSGYTEQQPPQLTAVDQFTVRQGSIKVRTFIERLFFRAAHRAAARAAAARD